MNWLKIRDAIGLKKAERRGVGAWTIVVRLEIQALGSGEGGQGRRSIVAKASDLQRSLLRLLLGGLLVGRPLAHLSALLVRDTGLEQLEELGLGDGVKALFLDLVELLLARAHAQHDVVRVDELLGDAGAVVLGGGLKSASVEGIDLGARGRRHVTKREERLNERFAGGFAANAHVFHDRGVTELCSASFSFILGRVHGCDSIWSLFILVYDDEDMLSSHCKRAALLIIWLRRLISSQCGARLGFATIRRRRALWDFTSRRFGRCSWISLHSSARGLLQENPVRLAAMCSGTDVAVGSRLRQPFALPVMLAVTLTPLLDCRS
nr:hypothetical protein CFP56_28562 [Quercus suber]